MYKAINELIPSPIRFIARIVPPYHLRGDAPLDVPFVRSNQSRRFLRVRGAQQWNELQPEVRNSRSLFSFKKKLKSFYLQQY